MVTVQIYLCHFPENEAPCLYFRTEIEVHEDNTQEPHYSFLSKDGFNKAVLKIEDAVRLVNKTFLLR